MIDTSPERFAYDGLTPHLFPEPVSSFIKSASRALGVDSTFVALPALAALAGAIGNSRRLQVKPGWYEPAMVWTAIVGGSGTLKSPSLKLVLGPLHNHQALQAERYRTSKEQFEAEQAIHAEAMKAWRNDGVKNEADPPPKPVKPSMQRTLASDVTTEAVAQLLRNNPRGILLAVDELSGWFGSFDAYRAGKGSDAARWLEIWSNGSLIVDRVKSDGEPLIIPRSNVSITGGIQPQILAGAISGKNTDNGLAARLLMAMPPTRPALWTDEGIDPEAEQAMTDTFSRLLALEGVREADDKVRPRTIYLTDQATQAYRSWHDGHAREQASMDEADAAAWSKLKGYCARFALIFHMCEVCSDTCRPEVDPDHIDAQTIGRAIALTEWFKRETQRITTTLIESEDQRVARELVARIQSNGGTITVRQLSRGSKKYPNAQAARDELRALEGLGFGVLTSSTPGDQGGRPKEIFTLSEVYDAKTYERPLALTS